MTTINRFAVTFASARCNGGDGRFRRPVHVRVMDRTQSEWHAVRGLNDGVKAVWRNVDSRYSGPRSEYGKALRAARELAERLNAEHADAVSACCVI